MSGTVSFAELDEQHVELLPARTVLSMFSIQDTGGAIPGGVTPDQVARGVLGFIGVAGASSGADGSNNGGNTGAGNL